MSEIIDQQRDDKNLEIIGSHVVFFYDGQCNLCSNFTEFVKTRDKLGLIGYFPLQLPQVKQLLINHNVDATQLNTIVCIVNDKFYTKSTAVIKILQNLSGPWVMIQMLLIIPVVIRDWVYDLVASNRYKWFGQREKCFLQK